MKEKQHFIAIDQYGHNIHLYTKYPRKELMDFLGAKKTFKIYIDRKSDGKPVHIGYGIKGRWFTIYKMIRMDAL